MALDPSIFNMLGRGKSSVDYANDFEDRDNKRNMLALQQQAMGMEQQRNALALDQARRQQADDAALRAYMLKQPDLSKPDAVAGLYSAAPTAAGGVLKTYNEGVKASREASAAQTQAQINQQKLADAQWEAQQKKHDKAVLDIANMTDPESALATLTRSAQAGEIPQDKVAGIQQAIAATQGNPQAFRDLKLKLITGLMDAKDRAAEERQATNDAATNANRPLVMGPGGQFITNEPYVAAQSRIAQASAPITMGSPTVANIEGIGPALVQTGNRPGAPAQVVRINGAPVKPPPAKAEGMSATLQKELVEADDLAQNSANVSAALKRALAINDKAYSGYGASTRAKVRSNLPGESDAANATVEMENIIAGQGLESLRAIFGGNPTEGERKILLDLQASADKTPTQRKAIIERALQAADKRSRFAKSRAAAIRNGTYLSQGAAEPSSDGWSMQKVE